MEEDGEDRQYPREQKKGPSRLEYSQNSQYYHNKEKGLDEKIGELIERDKRRKAISATNELRRKEYLLSITVSQTGFFILFAPE
ncbi:MAG TPA: hypothetical protein VGJ94_02515 [Syntrophorhabdaceae bacterium]